MTNRLAAQIARALGDPLRVAILHRLMEGPAAVADLVATTGESQPKVSNHLAVLRERGLVVARRRTRQSVYELRNASVAQLVEALLLTSGARPRQRAAAPIALARTCYDHLAGKLGVAIFDTLVRQQALLPPDRTRGKVALGPIGAAVFGRLGVQAAPPPGRRRFAYACLDWTERRPHLGGWLGAALCERALMAGWIEKDRTSRAVFITSSGRRALKRHLGLDARDLGLED